MKAALLAEPQNGPIIVDDVECAEPAPKQIQVEISHCGICHSDLSVFEAPVAPGPMILGHEAAGVVSAIGPGVRDFEVGDSVMLSPFPPCGRCYHCVRGETVLCVDAVGLLSGLFPDGSSPFSRNGELVYRGLGVGGFAEHTVVSENAAVKIAPDIPRSIASVMGCSVQTGVGAVLNTAKMEAGATALVMGLGGIGISVLQGTRIAGATKVIATDPVESRRKMALEFGATDVLDPTEVDVAGFVKDLTGGIGVDYAFDAVGNSELILTGMNAIRKGGMTVIVGAPPAEQDLTIPTIVMMMLDEKKLIGSLYGSSDSRREVPRLLDLWKAGKLDLEGMISHRRPLDDINLGLEDMRNGRGLRTILEL